MNGATVPSGTASSTALSVGSNTITILVTAQNGAASKTYTLTVTRAASADASLASVGISVGNLSPAFDPAVFNYTAAVSNTTTSITFSPAASSNASIKINSTPLSGNPTAGIVNLNVGANTITMDVTAQDGSVKTYTFVVTREQAIAQNTPNTAPTLAAIANVSVCSATTVQSIQLTGITTGAEPGQITTLSVSSNNASMFRTLTVNGSGNTGTINYALAQDAVGTATVTVTVTDNGGTANGGTDTFIRTFTISANAIPDVRILSDLGTSISLGAIAQLTATGGSSYAWSNANGIIAGQTNATLTVKPLVNTTYTVTVIGAGGCSVVRSINIEVKEDFKTLEATNILSPNADGTNDVWVVKNIELYPKNEVKVFDRGGRIVFTEKGYKNSWDATINGSPLAEGTYYYIVDFGDNKGKRKGFITIVR
ncbi:MAG: T9SS type B sorting domain-containing protein [Sphingobacteriales bacterium]|nr:MAG: T9SS type B sorting domain-containing protein [Sphingobacteriales bacterium]